MLNPDELPSLYFRPPDNPSEETVAELKAEFGNGFFTKATQAAVPIASVSADCIADIKSALIRVDGLLNQIHHTVDQLEESL